MENLITLSEEKGLEKEKYEQSGVIARFLIDRFYRSIKSLIPANTTGIFEVGCGEGYSIERLRDNRSYRAIDVDPEMVASAQKRNPDVPIEQGDIYKLKPVSPREIVLCLEVLEHLERPDEALEQIFRITSEYAIVSVPSEPLWHIGNLLRGKYLKEWGNGPGHINHWTPGQFKRFCEKKFQVEKIKMPPPWTILLLKKRIS